MKILVVGKQKENVGELMKVLPAFITIAEVVTDYSELRQKIKLHRPDIVMFNMNMAQEYIADPIAEMPYLLAVADFPNPEYLRLGVELKARDLLIKPFNIERLNDAINKAITYMDRDNRDKVQNTEAQAVSNSKVVSFYSPQGGVGQSTTAVNLAVDLAKITDSSVVVIDTNNIFGTVPILLDMIVDKNLTDIIVNNSQSNLNEIEEALVSHPVGIKVLPGPQDDLNIKVEDIVTIINTLKAAYDYIIVDMKKMVIDENLEIFDLSDYIFFMLSLNIPNIRNASVALHKMSSLYIKPEKIKIVVNHIQENEDIEVKEVEEHLKTSVCVQLPFNSEIMSKSVNEGKPFIVRDPDSALSAAIREMSYVLKPSIVSEGPATAATKEKKGFLSALFKK